MFEPREGKRPWWDSLGWYWFMAGFVFGMMTLPISRILNPVPVKTEKAVTEVKSNESEHVVIIDVRPDPECGDGKGSATLMEHVTGDNYRFSRCGYFGSVGDKFYWYGK